MARSDMSDLEWEFIKAVLPNKARGKKPAPSGAVYLSFCFKSSLTCMGGVVVRALCCGCGYSRDISTGEAKFLAVLLIISICHASYGHQSELRSGGKG